MAVTKEEKFDAADYRIITLLHENARMPEKEIGALLGLTEKEVKTRISRLLEAGAGKLTLMINPEAFGYVLAADIYLSLDKTREKEIIEELRQNPNVTYLGHGQEEGKIALEVRFKNSNDLYNFIKLDLPAQEGIKLEEFTLLPKILKNIDQWVPPKEDFR